MSKPKTRKDTYIDVRKHLTDYTDEDLKKKFWALADEATKPLIELAKTHTTPAIERSVLLRMGFSSLEAQALVKKIIEHQLMGKGAGHVVFRYARLKGLSIRDAGLALIQDTGWDDVLKSFEVKQ